MTHKLNVVTSTLILFTLVITFVNVKKKYIFFPNKMNKYYIMISFGLSFNFLTLNKTLNIVASPLASAQKTFFFLKKIN